MITGPLLTSWLRQYWNLTAVSIAVHDGGMGSTTWFVGHDGGRWVAKAVAPAAGSQFTSGLSVAQWLERTGISAGAPVPATDGQLAVNVGEGWLALLTWVPGHSLTGRDSGERELIGTTLAGVHRARDPLGPGRGGSPRMT